MGRMAEAKPQRCECDCDGESGEAVCSWCCGRGGCACACADGPAAEVIVASRRRGLGGPSSLAPDRVSVVYM